MRVAGTRNISAELAIWFDSGQQQFDSRGRAKMDYPCAIILPLQLGHCFESLVLRAVICVNYLIACDT